MPSQPQLRMTGKVRSAVEAGGIAPGGEFAYASSSLSFAALEYFVNLTPEDLVSVQVEIPDGVKVEQLEISWLPLDWPMRPPSPDVQVIGDRWLAAGSTAVLAVPSILIPPPEINFLINPGHADFNSLKFQEPVEFRFDPRMWKG